MKKRFSVFTLIFGILLSGCTVSDKCTHKHKQLMIDTAKCTTSGIKQYKCNDCGEYFKEYSSALGHDYSILVSDTSTCTQSGEKTYKCTRCGEKTHEHAPAKGHDYGNAICHNCGGLHPDFDAKTMTSSFKWQKSLYLLNSSLSAIASVTIYVEFAANTTSAKITMLGASEKTCYSTVRVVDKDDKILDSAHISFIKSSSTAVNITANTKLSRGISVGEKLYLEAKLYG